MVDIRRNFNGVGNETLVISDTRGVTFSTDVYIRLRLIRNWN
jgi:hypothetical protein